MFEAKKYKITLPNEQTISAEIEETVLIKTFLQELISAGHLNEHDIYELHNRKDVNCELERPIGSLIGQEFKIVNISHEDRIKKSKNSMQWSSQTPGHIIFLIDQSNSMNEIYANGKSRAEYTAKTINETIDSLINANMSGLKIMDRAQVSLIGYGGSSSLAIDTLRSDYLSDYAQNPLKIKQITEQVPDGYGGMKPQIREYPIFIEPLGYGATPMVDALKEAKDIIEKKNQEQANCPAPIIFNISDGLPYIGKSTTRKEEMSKAIAVAKEIMEIETVDGNPVIFNVHIGKNGNPKYNFSQSEKDITDEQAKFLFKISSKIPYSYQEAAKKHDFKILPESRGFVSNADAQTFVKFINFGSTGGLIDPIF